MTLRERVEACRREMRQFVREHGTEKGLSLRDPHDVLEFVKENNIDSIRLWFTDLLGFLKSFSISPTELSEAFTYGMGFDGPSILGYKRIQEGDMVAFPLAQTAQLIPFTIGGSKAIRMFTSVYTPTNEPYASDTRQVLKNNLQRLSQYNLTHMNIGPEAEYFYFQSPSVPEGLDSAGLRLFTTIFVFIY